MQNDDYLRCCGKKILHAPRLKEIFQRTAEFLVTPQYELIQNYVILFNIATVLFVQDPDSEPSIGLL